VDLTQETSLRAGDSFQLQIQGVAPRTATITIGPGETYGSLVTKINAQLGQIGTAAVNYTGTSETMTIIANPGNTINLVAGPADFDALGRLGIPAGVISAPAANNTSSTATNSSVTSGSTSSTVKPTFGLALTATALGPLDISTKTGADLAKSQLLLVLTNLQSTYMKTNTPPSSSTGANPGNTTGTVSSTTTAQLASYNMALSLLGTSSSSAMTNIETIVAGGSVGGSTGASSSSDSAAALLGLFN
jgi:hypothetical protein